MTTRLEKHAAYDAIREVVTTTEADPLLRDLVQAMRRSAHNQRNGCSCRGLSLHEEQALHSAESYLARVEGNTND